MCMENTRQFFKNYCVILVYEKRKGGGCVVVNFLFKCHFIRGTLFFFRSNEISMMIFF